MKHPFPNARALFSALRAAFGRSAQVQDGTPPFVRNAAASFTGWLTLRRRGIAACGVSLALLGAGAAQAQVPQAYAMQTMPLLAGATLSPWIEGMNSMGQVVGRTDIGSQVFATQWGVGQPARQLGALPAAQPWAMAHAISDAGVVVGDASWGSAYATHGFRWTAEGGMQDLSLGWAGGADTRALGINTAGQIAGSVTQANGIVAAVFQPDGTWTNLGHALPGAAGDYRISIANDISGSGWVVGSSAAGTALRAFRWGPQGGMTALQQFVAGSRDTAVAVNEMGWSAGTGWLGNSSSDARAVAWDAQGLVVPLQGSDWLHSSAMDINAAGTIVGEATRPDGRHAFVWNAGLGMVALDSLVLDLGGLQLLEADAINEAGQIAGVAWDPVARQVSAYLLTPAAAVPEPAPALMLAAGLALLVWRRRARHDA